MVMEDNESCSSRVHDSSSPAQSRQQRQKLGVYNEVLRRLKDSNIEEAFEPGFDEELWAHFLRLPTRYFCPSLFVSVCSYYFVKVFFYRFSVCFGSTYFFLRISFFFSFFFSFSFPGCDDCGYGLLES